jgi:hypothetical protein
MFRECFLLRQACLEPQHEDAGLALGPAWRLNVRQASRTWLRRIAGPLVALVGFTLMAPPAWAGSPATPLRPRPVSTAAMARVEALDARAVAAAQVAGGTAPASSQSFFKTKKGVATLVLMATGVTWALVSRSKDIITSPAR